MSQRILVAISFAMMCICLFVGWIAWSSSEGSQELNQTVSEQLAARNQNGTEILNQAREWIPCTLRLVSEAGPPVPKGFSVELSVPPHLNEPTDVDFREITFRADGDGVVDLGLLRRCTYIANIQAPWHQQTYVKVDTRVASSIDKTVCCPVVPLRVAPLVFNIDWPEDLKERGFSLCFSFTQDAQHRPELDGNSWSNSDVSYFQLVLSSDGRFVRMEDESFAAFQPFPLYGDNDGRLNLGIADLNEDTSVTLDSEAQLWVGKYRMISMFVLPQMSTVDKLGELPPHSLARVAFHPPTLHSKARQKRDKRIDMPCVFSEFVIRAGENNVWQLSPPPQFIDFVRRQIST